MDSLPYELLQWIIQYTEPCDRFNYLTVRRSWKLPTQAVLEKEVYIFNYDNFLKFYNKFDRNKSTWAKKVTILNLQAVSCHKRGRNQAFYRRLSLIVPLLVNVQELNFKPIYGQHLPEDWNRGLLKLSKVPTLNTGMALDTFLKVGEQLTCVTVDTYFTSSHSFESLSVMKNLKSLTMTNATISLLTVEVFERLHSFFPTLEHLSLASPIDQRVKSDALQPLVSLKSLVCLLSCDSSAWFSIIKPTYPNLCYLTLVFKIRSGRPIYWSNRLCLSIIDLYQSMNLAKFQVKFNPKCADNGISKLLQDMINRNEMMNHEITVSCKFISYLGNDANESILVTKSTPQDGSQTYYYSLHGTFEGYHVPVKEIQQLTRMIPMSARNKVTKLDIKRTVCGYSQHYHVYLDQILQDFTHLKQLVLKSENIFNYVIPRKGHTMSGSVILDNDTYYHNVAYYHLLLSPERQQPEENQHLKKIVINHLLVAADVVDMIFTKCVRLNELDIIDCVIQQDCMLKLVDECKAKQIKLYLK